MNRALADELSELPVKFQSRIQDWPDHLLVMTLLSAVVSTLLFIYWSFRSPAPTICASAVIVALSGTIYLWAWMQFMESI
jgi:hypothetical protein